MAADNIESLLIIIYHTQKQQTLTKGSIKEFLTEWLAQKLIIKKKTLQDHNSYHKMFGTKDTNRLNWIDFETQSLHRIT